MKLIEALEGMEVKEGDDFPQGDKTLRKEDHQAFLREFIFDIKDNKHRILEVDPEGEDDLPAGLQVRVVTARPLPGRWRPRPVPAGAPPPAPILRTEGLTMRFGGLTALNNVSIAVARGRDPRHHRPERRGQVHLLQLPHRRAAAHGRAHHPRTARTSPGCRRTRSRTRASPAPTRSPISCRAPRCSRTCASPPSRAATAGACCATTSSFPDILDADPRRAGRGRPRSSKEDELAANLSHGEQRNLEIGIALATEPQLLCLDEPTAGMSVSETHATVELVRRIAQDLTILIVEHDMEVVMGLAQHHHRAALRRGAGRGHAGARSRPTPRVQEVYLKT